MAHTCISARCSQAKIPMATPKAPIFLTEKSWLPCLTILNTPNITLVPRVFFWYSKQQGDKTLAIYITCKKNLDVKNSDV